MQVLLVPQVQVQALPEIPPTPAALLPKSAFPSEARLPSPALWLQPSHRSVILLCMLQRYRLRALLSVQNVVLRISWTFMDNVCSRICLSFKPDTPYTPYRNTCDVHSLRNLARYKG
jgi:hypothetical protein